MLRIATYDNVWYYVNEISYLITVASEKTPSVKEDLCVFCQAQFSLFTTDYSVYTVYVFTTCELFVISDIILYCHLSVFSL